MVSLPPINTHIPTHNSFCEVLCVLSHTQTATTVKWSGGRGLASNALFTVPLIPLFAISRTAWGSVLFSQPFTTNSCESRNTTLTPFFPSSSSFFFWLLMLLGLVSNFHYHCHLNHLKQAVYICVTFFSSDCCGLSVSLWLISSITFTCVLWLPAR